MPAKKPKKSSKPAPKKAVKKPAKTAPKAASRPLKKPPTKSKAKPAPAPRSAPAQPKKPMNMAERMAAFSQKVLEEEEEPVNVRTFNEARSGVDKSKELDVRSGTVSPTAPASTDEEEPVEFEEVEDEEPEGQETPAAPAQKPKMEPLTGPLAVPKRKQAEDFKFTPPPPTGKKGKLPTKEDLGKIELKMQRGREDKTVATASPDYLQRSFNKAAQSGKVAATGTTHEGKHEEEHFDVAMDKPKKGFDASIAEFGDVEIAQQTRGGKKTLGKLDTDEDDEKQ